MSLLASPCAASELVTTQLSCSGAVFVCPAGLGADRQQGDHGLRYRQRRTSLRVCGAPGGRVCVGQEVVQVLDNVRQTCCLAGLGRVPKRPSGQAPMSFDLKNVARLVIGDLLSLAVSVQAR